VHAGNEARQARLDAGPRVGLRRRGIAVLGRRDALNGRQDGGLDNVARAVQLSAERDQLGL
jgi:hypothetical protein